MVKVSKRRYKAMVTFILEKNGDSAILKGEWNNWEEIEMKKKKDGSFYVRVGVPFGKWEFGYLVDGEWVVEEDVEKTKNEFGGYNSLLVIGDEQ